MSDADIGAPSVEWATWVESDWANCGEVALVAGICRRRSEALAELYERFGAQCLSVAAEVAGVEQAGPIVQQVFLALWRQPDDFGSGIGTLRTFLLLRVYAAAVAQCRGDQGKRLATRAGDRLSRLPDLERDAIVLARFGECSVREISVGLGISASEAGGHISRGLRRIQVATGD